MGRWSKLFERTLSRQYLIAVLISLSMYLIFFHPLFGKNIMLTVVDLDPPSQYLPWRYFIWDSLHNNGTLYLWTEKILAGFPMISEPEAGLLNVFRVALIYIFGPLTSYKVEHATTYLLGSLGLYFFLKRRNVTLLGYIIANYIFFFNHFLLYHQEHYQIVLSVYLLPISLLALDLCIERPSYNRAFFYALSLAFITYFGHYQTVLTIILAHFALFVTSLSKKNLRIFLYMGITSVVVYVLLAMPTLFGTFQSYSTSDRAVDEESNFNWLLSSYRPSMIVNSFYPSFWGRGGGYAGTGVQPDLHELEVYNYIGIIGFIAGIFSAFVVWPSKRLKLFTFILCFIYFILGFYKYIPVLSDFTIPVISEFRGWGRSVITFNLGFAIMAALLFQQSKIRVSKSSIFSGAAFTLLFAGFFKLLSSRFEDPFSMFWGLKQIIFKSITFTDFNWWFWTAVSAAILCLLYPKLNRKLLVSLLILLLIGIDFKYSTTRILPRLFKEWNPAISEINHVLSDYSTKRVVIEPRGMFNRSRSFLYEPWGVWGYSQLTPVNYVRYLMDIGIGSSRGNTEDKNIDNLALLGVEYYINADGTVLRSFDNQDLLQQNGQYSYNVRKMNQGHYIYRINSASSQTLNTFIKYTDDWKITLDGRSIPYRARGNEKVFTSIEIPEGEFELEIKYFPVRFYLVCLISITFVFGNLVYFGSKYLRSKKGLLA
jgi:hypothetical protein